MSRSDRDAVGCAKLGLRLRNGKVRSVEICAAHSAQRVVQSRAHPEMVSRELWHVEMHLPTVSASGYKKDYADVLRFVTIEISKALKRPRLVQYLLIFHEG